MLLDDYIIINDLSYSDSKSLLFPTKVNVNFGFPFYLASSNHLEMFSNVSLLVIS